jgi:hypothetical protein
LSDALEGVLNGDDQEKEAVIEEIDYLMNDRVNPFTDGVDEFTSLLTNLLIEQATPDAVPHAIDLFHGWLADELSSLLTLDLTGSGLPPHEAEEEVCGLLLPIHCAFEDFTPQFNQLRSGKTEACAIIEGFSGQLRFAIEQALKREIEDDDMNTDSNEDEEEEDGAELV